MLFNSLEFILVFLPVTMLGVMALGQIGRIKLATLWLVACSLFFYSWWSAPYIILIMTSIIFNYTFAYLIIDNRQTHIRKSVVFIAVVFNLSLLAYFKYTDFAIENLNYFFDAEISSFGIVLPLAISFFTFQQIAYIVDCYRGNTRETSFLRYCLFVSFFPQLIAGPIVHHKEMLPQFERSRYRLQIENLSVGLSIFIIGLSKKVLIADTLSPYVGSVFAAAETSDPTFFEAWGGALAYTFQLYFDFSGYSDMALGLGRIMGIRLPLNFNSPYKATNIADFWRRWHITLSRFLHAYLYIPLGGNRNGVVRHYTNLMTVMLLGGLWHGAGWTFVLWGGLHGGYLVVHRLLQWAATYSPSLDTIIRIRILAWTTTFTAVVIGWVFFRAESVQAASSLLRGMAGLNGVSFPTQLKPLEAPLSILIPGITFNDMGAFPVVAIPWVFFAGLLAFLTPNIAQIFHAAEPTVDNPCRPSRLKWQPRLITGLTLGILLFFCLRAQFVLAPSEFLYFNF